MVAAVKHSLWRAFYELVEVTSKRCWLKAPEDGNLRRRSWAPTHPPKCPAVALSVKPTHLPEHLLNLGASLFPSNFEWWVFAITALLHWQSPLSFHPPHPPNSCSHHFLCMKMILETKWDLKFCVWQAAWWKGFIGGLDPWKFYANNTAGQAI